jgi:hypothetical protein
MIVVSHTTTLSVLGAGMALRGPDGSMMTATDGLYDERKRVFYVFGVGMACTVVSLVICVWILLPWEIAVVCFGLTTYTCHTIWQNYQRVQSRFDFDESETVDFKDIMEGPAAIRAVPMNGYGKTSKDYKKASSFPTTPRESEPYDRFDLEWQSSQQLINKGETVTKRRGRNSSPSSEKEKGYIQTI